MIRLYRRWRLRRASDIAAAKARHPAGKHQPK